MPIGRRGARCCRWSAYPMCAVYRWCAASLPCRSMAPMAAMLPRGAFRPLAILGIEADVHLFVGPEIGFSEFSRSHKEDRLAG